MARVFWPTAMLHILAVVAFAAFAFQAMHFEREFDNTSPRYTLYGYPIAISALRTGEHDYTAAWAIAGQFVLYPERSVGVRLAIAQTTPINTGHERWFVSGDDKGVADMALLAFSIFGIGEHAVALLIVHLIGLSALLFLITYRSDPAALSLLIAVLCGMYAVTFTLGLNDQGGGIAEPRFIGVLGVIATLHLMLMCLRSAPPSRGTVLLALAQAVILVLAFHVRTTEAWQIIAVGCFGLVGLLAYRRWSAALPVALVAGVAASLSVWTTVAFNDAYFDENLSGRVLWHNALMVLSLDETIADAYGLRGVDDNATTEAVRAYMPEPQRSTLFKDDTYANGNFAGFNWRKYEVWARKMYLDILRDHPMKVLRVYALDVPAAAGGAVRYTATGGLFAQWYMPPGTYMSPDERDRHDIYWSLLRPLPLAILALTIIAALLHPSAAWLQGIGATGLMLAGSSVPWMLVYPAVQYMQVSLLLAGSLVYILAVVALVRLFSTPSSRSAASDLYRRMSRSWSRTLAPGRNATR